MTKGRSPIFIGADHRGFALKAEIAAFLKTLGHEVIDAGTYEEEPCDYPVIAYEARESAGALELAGRPFDKVTIGIGVPKDAGRLKAAITGAGPGRIPTKKPRNEPRMIGQKERRQSSRLGSRLEILSI